MRTGHLGIITLSVSLLGNLLNGHAQIYELSAPLSGFMTLGARDANAFTNAPGRITLSFTDFVETVYIDPIALTIRQVGSFSVTPSASEFVIHEYQLYQPSLGDLRTNFAEITVRIAPLSTNFSFDTGPRSMAYDAVLKDYKFNSTLALPSIPVIGSYSLTTGEQTIQGTFSYALSRAYAGSVNLFRRLIATNYPNSIFLDQFYSTNTSIYNPWSNACAWASSPATVADVTATNGLHMVLAPGATNWFAAACEFWIWSSPPTVATLSLSNPPSIASQPQSQTVQAHTTALFNVGAFGSPLLNYQWSLNGTNLPGATYSTLSIANVRPADLGDYSVVVTNAFGSVTSSNATLSMYPYIASPFQGATAIWGKDSTLSVGAWGTGPLTYQWFKDGSEIEGATNETFTLRSAQFTNAGLYSVVVNSPFGTATNSPAQVIVYPAGVSLGLFPGVIIDGVPGYSYTIQRTADLSDTNSWVTLTNLTLMEPIQIWVDTSTDASLPYNPRRYYQVLPGQ